MLLSHAVLTPPDVPAPGKWLFFLHGILGTGANWRSFAKELIKADPTWGAVLVDLRLHGESLTGFPPPHTLAAAAADVAALAAAVEQEHGGAMRAILAHSFGGKVALDLATRREGDLDHLFVIDSTPSARPDRRGSESTQHIVDLLTTLPAEFENRGAFTAYMEQQGVSRPTAMWLAMNIRALPNTTRFVFKLDVAGIRELLEDYFRVDEWPILERPPAASAMQAHLVVGGKSGVVDAADRARAALCPSTTLDIIEKADHWVHADAPEELRAIVLGYLLGAGSA
ncbi:MAG: putative hydrolase, alpha/beta fold family [Labilithrix sp.]|nr:putative hydrolase, alpha/beta fold family [Labilithrix sp.]